MVPTNRDLYYSRLGSTLNKEDGRAVVDDANPTGARGTSLVRA